MEELKITKERVLKAAETCSTAKEVLKELFPEAFEKRYKDFDIFTAYEGIRVFYKGNIYNLDREHCSNDYIYNYKYVGNLSNKSVQEHLINHIKERFLKIR